MIDMYMLVRGNLNQFWSRTASVAWASLTSAWEIVLPGWPTGARQQLSSVNSYRWSFSSQAGSNACLQHGLLCWWGSSLSQGSCQHQWLHTMWLWVAFYFGFHHCHIWTRNYVKAEIQALRRSKITDLYQKCFPQSQSSLKMFCWLSRPTTWSLRWCRPGRRSSLNHDLHNPRLSSTACLFFKMWSSPRASISTSSGSQTARIFCRRFHCFHFL